MPIPVGSKAPEFTLRTKTALGLQDIRLSDNFSKRPTVLLFFPLAFTSVCTTEMCSVRDSMAAYAKLDAAVYGISVDSPFTLEQFALSQNLNFPLLSDFNREVCKAYGVQYDQLLGFQGVAKRSAFVVGRDGVVKFSWCSDDPKVLPDFAALQAALANA